MVTGMRVVILLAAFSGALSTLGRAEDDDCVRGLPQAVIDAEAPGIDKHAYTELPERKAIEAVTLKDGLQFRVHHYGCAHYGLTFEFMVDTPKAENGLTLLREAALLLERLVAADPDSYAGSFLKDVEKAVSQQSHEPGDTIPVIDGYSWIIITEETDAKGQRWIQLAYDIAL
ncbi:hypothetical protein MTYP_02023 [Methylophilaceae bacterium]|nr:hypothetical protein MTYP_02023 [Methylophilaceae bacterium]